MIYLYFALIIMCTLTGYIVGNKYRIRVKIYGQLLEFLNYYKMEISYSKSKLAEIVKNFLNNQRVDYLNFKEFNEFLNKDKLYCNEFRYSNFNTALKSNEINYIQTFLNSLGTYDSSNENYKIDLAINNVKNIYNNELIKKEKYFGLSIKVGLIIGCFIVVLII